MAKVSPLMVLPPLIFAGLAGLFYVGMFREDPDSLPSTRIGQPAPAVTEVALPGFAAITPADLAADEVTVVNFWASWCPPCRAEHPILLQMQEQGVHLIGVNFKDDEANATKYLTDEGNPFDAVAFDPQGRTAIEWGVTAPPETFILDGEGTVLYRFAGPLVGSDYEQRFLPELQKAQAK
ncbi:DsbE family thiol:disulfide interchange protein [Pseudoprimorskyibacter insulae]|uniref:Thiol:disulfide interchange protein CycY n=1 Tax=Pseudoprimorskyibacter insulae TaxID=1695997 RepID=A0A2R8AXZ1_9RHOB|nr:DsbE family thiol:disulfide interchange protein [Pseudoprimorskyibacter insulae]SPF80870.1 Thiol:disulfide interchange protein CycY [Pseudoprimorskyibacter insulae]